MKATRLDVANHTTPLSRRRGAGGEAVGEGPGVRLSVFFLLVVKVRTYQSLGPTTKNIFLFLCFVTAFQYLCTLDVQ